jgi:hypothetical protein
MRMKTSSPEPGGEHAPALSDEEKVAQFVQDATGGKQLTRTQRAKEIAGLDLASGCVAGIGSGFAAAYGAHTLDNATTVLTTEVLLGGGLLAVVLAALTLLATFLDGEYRAALGQARGGFRGAMLPFKVVAFAGAFAAITGVLAIALWGTLPRLLQDAAFGLVSGATVWAVVGTLWLVLDTTFHGTRRAELLETDRLKAMFERRRRSA